MGFRNKVRTLERQLRLRGQVASSELRGCSRFYYDAGEVYKEVFVHGLDCLRSDSLEDQPEPSEVYRKMCEARDPAAVLERLTLADFLEFPYEMDALLDERCLVPLPHEPVPDPAE